jgi:hypothetical protein
MKKHLLIVSIALMGTCLLAQEQKVVVTGVGYANDVYYSLEFGIRDTVPINNWDIAFTTYSFSSSILANNGAGVELYTWNLGDIDDWDNVDTTGMEWKPMYNSIETWEEGAFGANALGHPDYGWGTYDMSTHNLTGDSIFIIKTVGGNWKKLAIIERQSQANNWTVQFDNLDGSDPQNHWFRTEVYTQLNFLHMNLDSSEVFTREPNTSLWDLLFTKYYDNTIPYTVTGVLINDDHVLAQEVRESGMDQSTHNSFVDTSFNTNMSEIGSDWKSFDMGSMSYVMVDTVVYYLKTNTGSDSSYYKIYFTDFSGSMGGGIYTFMQEEMELGVSTGAPGEVQVFQVYPNPAGDHINVVFDLYGRTDIDIIDMTGRLVYTTTYESSGFTNMSLNLSSLTPGVFFVRVSAEGQSNVLRFIKE